MDTEIKHGRNPFEVLLKDYNERIDEHVDALVNEVEGGCSTLSKAKSDILKCAFAVLYKRVLEESREAYAFTDFQEVIKETKLQRWQHESWYLFGAEGIKWQDDEAWNEAPFELMMEELLIKYVYWWSDYLRANKSQEQRIEILSRLMAGYDVAGSQLYMQAVNFYIRPFS